MDTSVSATALLEDGSHVPLRSFSKLRSHAARICVLDISLSAASFVSSQGKSFFQATMQNLTTLTLTVIPTLSTHEGLNFHFSPARYPSLVELTVDGAAYTCQNCQPSEVPFVCLRLRNYPFPISVSETEAWLKYILRRGPLIYKLELTNYLTFPPDSPPPSSRLLDGVTHLTRELIIKDNPRRIAWLLSCHTHLPPKVEISTSLSDSIDDICQRVFLCTLPPPGQHLGDLMSPSLQWPVVARLKLDNGNVGLRWASTATSSAVSLDMASGMRGPAAGALHHAALFSVGAMLFKNLAQLECVGTFDGVDRAAWMRLFSQTKVLRQLGIRDLGAEGLGVRTMFEALQVILPSPPNPSGGGAVCQHLERVEVLEGTKYSKPLLQAVVKAAEGRAQHRIGFKKLLLDLEPVLEAGKDQRGRAMNSVVHARNAPEGWHQILSRFIGEVHMPGL